MLLNKIVNLDLHSANSLLQLYDIIALTNNLVLCGFALFRQAVNPFMVIPDPLTCVLEAVLLPIHVFGELATTLVTTYSLVIELLIVGASDHGENVKRFAIYNWMVALPMESELEAKCLRHMSRVGLMLNLIFYVCFY